MYAVYIRIHYVFAKAYSTVSGGTHFSRFLLGGVYKCATCISVNTFLRHYQIQGVIATSDLTLV